MFKGYSLTILLEGDFNLAQDGREIACNRSSEMELALISGMVNGQVPGMQHLTFHLEQHSCGALDFRALARAPPMGAVPTTGWWIWLRWAG
jgi:hypothetical protein